MQGIVDMCSGNTKHPPNCSVPACAWAAYTRSLGFEAMPGASGLALGGVWNSCPVRVLGRLRGSCPGPAFGGMWRQLPKTACGAAAAARRNKEDA